MTVVLPWNRGAMLDRAGAEPLLKWAGGKRQLLPHLREYVPSSMTRYIEPMIGGGALFFSLAPASALIADLNAELVNFYQMIVSSMDALIDRYEAWAFNEETFYELRALRFETLSPVDAAARTLYLNRACFNGLYRVNRHGQFNVPWGRYKRPYVVDRIRFSKAREVLSRAEIQLGDYKTVLRASARAGDFIFLDPPYVPVARYSDFKRYTPSQFHEADHAEMAELVGELVDIGCNLLITNSNHPLVHDLFRGYEIKVVASKRLVNSRANGRSGEDIIIYARAS